MARGRFARVVCVMRHIHILLCNPLIFFPLGIEGLITSLHLIQPFMKIPNLVQLLRGYFLGQPNLHTHPKLCQQLVIRKVQSSATDEGVLGLEANSIIPEGTHALGHGEKFAYSIFPPVLCKIVEVEICHECVEQHGNKVII